MSNERWLSTTELDVAVKPASLTKDWYYHYYYYIYPVYWEL